MNRDEDRDYEWERKTREVHGATHVLRESDKTQEDDPSWKLAYGAPEELSVSQEIEHGPEMSRHQSFVLGTRDADDSYGPGWWRDLFTGRRSRRYRRAWNGYPGDEPYGPGLVDDSRFMTY